MEKTLWTLPTGQQIQTTQRNYHREALTESATLMPLLVDACRARVCVCVSYNKNINNRATSESVSIHLETLPLISVLVLACCLFCFFTNLIYVLSNALVSKLYIDALGSHMLSKQWTSIVLSAFTHHNGVKIMQQIVLNNDDMWKKRNYKK